jgi:hypothetical protein
MEYVEATREHPWTLAEIYSGQSELHRVGFHVEGIERCKTHTGTPRQVDVGWFVP